MKINSLNSPYSFKSATININAFSDVHGHIERADCAYQTMLKNETFENDKRKGKINFLINGGDWFVSNSNIDFKNSLNDHFADFQLLMYKKFLDTLKKTYPNLKSIFIPGNHEFDSGAGFFNKIINNIGTKFISTNMDIENSDGLSLECLRDKLVNSTIDFVADDKNPEVKYPILNIGVSPLNMRYFNSDLKGINFINNIPHDQKKLTNKHYQPTLNVVKSTVEDFKTKYPQGIVIATCHTGGGFAQELAKQSDIDIIFNAHEHKQDNEEVNKTPIINLSQDFEKIANAKIKIDDNGNISDINIKDCYPTRQKIRHRSAIGKHFNKLFGREAQKTHTISCVDKTVNELRTDGIRNGNNNLANFVVDIALKKIQEFQPDIDIFALNSSCIRSGFELSKGQNTSNVDILNCLTGINAKQGEIYTTEVTGVELVEFILQNFLGNITDDNDPIMQYAGIRINRTGMIQDYLNGKNFDELCRHIISKKTGRMVIPNGKYKIANTLKHFQKSEDKGTGILFGRSRAIGLKLHDLFQNYFSEHEPVIFNTEKRIY